MVSNKKILWEFPIGSYVKLSSAVVTILVGVLKCRTQFWKKDHTRMISAKLVEISQVVSEEDFF
jgi:hypothetical protein